MSGRFIRRFLTIIGGLCSIGALAGIALLWQFQAPGPLAEPVTLVFPKGSGLQSISDILASEGVIPSSLAFKIAAVALRANTHFKAGEYAFPAHVSPQGVMQMLSEGKIVIRRFTVAEGLRVRDVRMLLEHEAALTGEVPADIAEGSLLPETYNFTYGDSRAELVERMQKSLRQTLQELWGKRKENLPLKDPREALIMASIVEKETGIASERARVAAVYENRLKRGMKLQADPTTRYAVELADGPMNRPLTLNDLKRDLPYNTYAVEGLPPGPIANPGRASIEAALNPAETEDLYFVATGDGGHWFAKSLQEHENNVHRFRMRQSILKKE